jgi:putative NADH-flavin reductase
MNITIFGASRGVGRAAVDTAVARGHAVTAVARSAGFASAGAARTIVGDVLQDDVVARALDGADGVIVALGTAPSKREHPAQQQVCSRGTQAILGGMKRQGQRRIVVVSSYGIGPTAARRPFPFNLVAATLLKDVMADKERQEALIRESDTEWTIAQPLGLTDAPATGRAFISLDGGYGGTRVARADVAAVCVTALEARDYLRATIAISASR